MSGRRRAGGTGFRPFRSWGRPTIGAGSAPGPRGAWGAPDVRGRSRRGRGGFATAQPIPLSSAPVGQLGPGWRDPRFSQADRMRAGATGVLGEQTSRGLPANAAPFSAWGPTGSPHESRLADLCVPVFTLAFELTRLSDVIASIQRGIDDGSLDAESGPFDDLPSIATDGSALRTRIEALFVELDDAARREGVVQESVRDAKYALAAYLDERIVSTQLPARELWLTQTLGLDLFNDNAAGEGFYERLDNLRRQRDRDHQETLEVFLLCLSFGFRGKLADAQGEEQRKVLIHQVARELFEGEDEAGPIELAPNGALPDTLEPEPRRLPNWVPAALGLLAFVILFAIYDGTLDNLVQTLSAIHG